MAANEVVRRDPAEQLLELAMLMPDYFDEQVERGAILGMGEQLRLSLSDTDTVFNRLFVHNTAYGIGLLPDFASPATQELEEEFLHALQTLRPVWAEDLPEIRQELGARVDIFALKMVGTEIYTQPPREEGSAMETGGIEFKVNSATQVPGPRFVATQVSGYYGILRYFSEEIAKVAPEGANAFQVGTTILRSVRYQGTWSPIVAGNVLRPIEQEEDQYHILPVKFFNVDVDTSQRYEGDWKVIESTPELTRMQYEVTPIKE
jgi:hypothetical protein